MPARTRKRTVARNTDPRTLFVSRPLENAADFIAWAKLQGFAKALPAGDVHCTIAFSKRPMQWPTSSHVDPVTVRTQSGRSVEALGDDGAVVLRFESPVLEARWKELGEAGASWDFESYKPHVTISWDAADVDLSQVEPYLGELVFGPEIFREINEDWKADVTEKANPNHDDLGRFSEGSGAGSGSGKSEESHPTMPLPSKPESYAMYDWFDEDEENHLVRVERRPDKSYYADTGEFDFTRPNAATMRARLKDSQTYLPAR